MKYKLLKDLPWASAGTICEGFEGDCSTYHISIPNEGSFGFPEYTFSDWFEEVDERWKPDWGCKYFTLDSELLPVRNTMSHQDETLWKIGLMFKTYEIAQRAAEQIKALLKEFHKKNP